MPLAECYRPRLFVSGETPGTGASTVSKLLVAALEQVPAIAESQLSQVTKISGGRYQRAFALELAELEEQNQSYVHLFQKYRSLLITRQFDQIRQHLSPRFEILVEEPVLKRFQQQIESHTLPNKQISTQWDEIIDHLLVEDALEAEQFVLDSKLAGVLRLLDQIRQDFDTSQSLWILPCLNVLLTVDPEIAAQRVTEREQNPVTVEDILARRDRDFARYETAYTINGQPLRHADLAKYADIHLNTENINPPEAAIAILRAYIDLLSSTSQHAAVNDQQEVSLPAEWQECPPQSEPTDFTAAFAYLEAERRKWINSNSQAA